MVAQPYWSKLIWILTGFWKDTIGIELMTGMNKNRFWNKRDTIASYMRIWIRFWSGDEHDVISISHFIL